ncbi:MAG: deoxyribose-phosphate aldolase [Saprospiraceae bacterium]
MNLASYIDSTLLKADCSVAEIELLCQEAIELEIFSVCVPPYFVPLAIKCLDNSKIKTSTVIGFPMGYSNSSAKLEEIKKAIDDGAHEFDAVVNLLAIKQMQKSYLRQEIDSMVRILHMRDRKLKIIIEAGLLKAEEIEFICQIASDQGVDFIKTSTGFNGPGATVEMVKAIRASIVDEIQIKASGGISTAAQALTLIEAGASRIGTSHARTILTS